MVCECKESEGTREEWSKMRAISAVSEGRPSGHQAALLPRSEILVAAAATPPRNRLTERLIYQLVTPTTRPLGRYRELAEKSHTHAPQGYLWASWRKRLAIAKIVVEYLL